MNDKDYKKFFDAITDSIATKVLESSIVANEISRLISRRPDVIDKLVGEIDPAKVAEGLARSINHLSHTGRANNILTAQAASTYSRIMDQASKQATEIITAQMVKDAMEIR